jgi:hypothetical protein
MQQNIELKKIILPKIKKKKTGETSEINILIGIKKTDYEKLMSILKNSNINFDKINVSW